MKCRSLGVHGKVHLFPSGAQRAKKGIEWFCILVQWSSLEFSRIRIQEWYPTHVLGKYYIYKPRLSVSKQTITLKIYIASEKNLSEKFNS